MRAHLADVYLYWLLFRLHRNIVCNLVLGEFSESLNSPVCGWYNKVVMVLVRSSSLFSSQNDSCVRVCIFTHAMILTITFKYIPFYEFLYIHIGYRQVR